MPLSQHVRRGKHGDHECKYKYEVNAKGPQCHNESLDGSNLPAVATDCEMVLQEAVEIFQQLIPPLTRFTRKQKFCCGSRNVDFV